MTAESPAPAEASAAGPGPESEITWLLHRAAQRMHAVTEREAVAHGLQLRDYIILSALDKTTGLTQIELGRVLGLDKTTLTSQLDRLERNGLIERRPDPRDRRARIPVITEEGEALRSAAARSADEAERHALRDFDDDDIVRLRRILFAIVGDTDTDTDTDGSRP
ncbi:MarR family winged helix-turn-helix transcriptional regulator [Cryocola sp. 340MFSha3.1]|uniref:MarR family winged helix-turn-helix transcriptional regulator n=1 Tax=Cryocola sp. 340MFSha3.1 TaxID=1169145 RepID=UPI000368C001|nr:MarR family winged helix-turn-helix transcriptional regulator [Cryocola sp. 340MFSha3.1]